MRIICDIETTGLILPKKGEFPEKIWCIVAKDIDTGNIYRFVRDEESKKYYDVLPQHEPISNFKTWAEQVEEFIGHNFVKYDAIILNKKLGTNITVNKITDTLVMSIIGNPERRLVYEKKIEHALHYYGKYFKFPKIEHDEWDKFSPEMLARCEQDIHLNHKVYDYLVNDLKNFSSQSIRNEHLIALHIFNMCRNGVAFDEEKAQVLYKEVVIKEKELKEELQNHYNYFPVVDKTVEPRYCKDKVNSKGEIVEKGRLSVVNRKNIPDGTETEIQYSILVWKDGEYSSEKLAEIEKELYKIDWLSKDSKDFTTPLRNILKNPSIEAIHTPIAEHKHLPQTFTIIEWQVFNPNSHKQATNLLNLAGWKPWEKTKAGNKAWFALQDKKITQAEHDEIMRYGFKVSEDNLETLPEDCSPEIKKLSLYKMVQNRESMLRKQYFPSIRDGRIYGDVYSCGAVTNRMTHRNPNLGNIVSVKTDENDNPLRGIEGRYGVELRELFTVHGEDRRLLGTDAEQLELRMLGHDMNDQNFINTLVKGNSEDGTDVHTMNQKVLSLSSRKTAKTFIFAFIYGAGYAKLGSIVDGNADDGKRLKNQFFNSLPKLRQIFFDIKSVAERDGVIRGLDGRVINVRKAYAALNSRLQSSGAIVCKYWLCYIMQEIYKQKIDAKLVLAVHDEYQFDVHKDDAERLGKVCQKAIIKAGETLNLKLPLLANYKIGKTWAETH